MNSLLPRLAAAVLVAATLVGRPSGPADAQDLTVADRVDIVRIDSYLRSLDTVQARFALAAIYDIAATVGEVSE